MTDPFLTEHPTSIRIWFDDGETDGAAWNVDGVDDEGRYTEACARFATEAEAKEHAPTFAQRFGLTYEETP